MVIDSGLSLELPSNIVGEVYSPWRQSHIKPWAAPGIIIPGHNNISVLLGNLTNQEMKIRRHQVVPFVHLQEKEYISSFHEFGTLEEFGLPEAKTNILSVIKR